MQFKKKPISSLSRFPVPYQKLKLFSYAIFLCLGMTRAVQAQEVQTNTLYDKYPWAITYYYGITGSDALMRILQGEFHRWPEHIQSVELTHTLSRTNFLRHFVSPVVDIVQVSGNITRRNSHGENVITEFDPYVSFRWANWPWNDYLNTSFALGEGISYASSVPSLEKKTNDNTKRLLNYLMLEATFALPAYPQIQIIARIHHRSGAYGLYHAGNTGSNAVGLGISYLFD